MAYELKGRTALVTGAAKRIGRQIALELADEGVNIIIHYVNSRDEAEGLRTGIEAKGVRAWALSADFDKDGGEGLIQKALQEAGDIDILVNNASIFPVNRLKDMTFEGLMSNIRVNAWAPFALGRDLARLGGKRKIVNLVDSRVTGYDWTHVEYLLSKHLLSELTRMMAVEFAPDVAVNGVNPGLILPPPGKDEAYLEKMDRTVPLKRHGDPHEIAAAVTYILKSEFLAGEVINVDGGRHVLEYDKGPHPD